MDVVPVRRDGTGRLVAVGLIAVVDNGAERWTTIGGPDMADESIDEAIERCLAETLGSDAHGQLSRPRPVGMTEARRRTNRDEIDEPYAVEIWGKLEPHGVARRFSWFLVTALPAHSEIASGRRPVLADFLEAQGEPGLAARLRQF